MPTIEELGASVKKKYPDYKDMSDLEVGRKVKEKFPEQYKDYTDAPEQKRALMQRRMPSMITGPGEQLPLGLQTSMMHTAGVLGTEYTGDPAKDTRKALVGAATLATGFLPGMAELPWLKRAAVMGISGMGADAWSQNLSRALGYGGPSTPKAAAKEIMQEGALQASAEVLGTTAAAGGSKLIGKATTAAKQVYETASKYDLPVGIGELRGGIPKAVQWVGEHMLFGRSFSTQMREKFLAGLNVAAEETLSNIGRSMTQQEAGIQVKNMLSEARSNFYKVESAAYEGFFDRVETVLGKQPHINLDRGAKEEMVKIAKEMGEVDVKFPSLMETTGKAKAIIEAFNPYAQAKGGGFKFKLEVPKVTIREANALRSKLLDITRETGDEGLARLAKRFSEVVRKATDESLESANPTLSKQYEALRTTYREGKGLFESKVFQGLAEKYPEQLAHSVKMGDYTAMRDIRDALVKHGQSNEQWELFRRMWLQDKMHAPELTGVEPGIKLMKGILSLSDALNSQGKPIREEFFSDIQGRTATEGIDKLASVIRSKIKMTESSDQNMFVIFSTIGGIVRAGAAMALLGTGHPALSAVEAAMPTVITRMAYNPTAMRMFIEGMDKFTVKGVQLGANAHSFSQMMRAMELAMRASDIKTDKSKARSEGSVSVGQ